MDNYTIMPYVLMDGIPTFRDTQLGAMYNRMVTEKLLYIFHDGTITNVYDWLATVKDPKNIFWALYCNEQLAGFCQFTHVDKAKAFCHFLVYKEWWGSGKTVPGGQYAMQEALKIFNTVMGMCPASNIFAVAYLKEVGLTHIMDVPNALWSKQEGKAVTGSLLYITREELDEDIQ